MAYTAPKGVIQMVVASQNGSDVPNSNISSILTGVIRRTRVHNTQDSFSFSYMEAQTSKEYDANELDWTLLTDL